MYLTDCVSGSALDISDVTLINPDPVVSSADASLLCVSSDWTSSGPASLTLGHEFPLPQQDLLSSTADKSYRSAARVSWRTRRDIFGAFFCKVKNSDSGKVYTYKMHSEGEYARLFPLKILDLDMCSSLAEMNPHTVVQERKPDI